MLERALGGGRPPLVRGPGALRDHRLGAHGRGAARGHHADAQDLQGAGCRVGRSGGCVDAELLGLGTVAGVELDRGPHDRRAPGQVQALVRQAQPGPRAVLAEAGDRLDLAVPRPRQRLFVAVRGPGAGVARGVVRRGRLGGDLGSFGCRTGGGHARQRVRLGAVGGAVGVRRRGVLRAVPAGVVLDQRLAVAHRVIAVRRPVTRVRARHVERAVGVAGGRRRPALGRARGSGSRPGLGQLAQGVVAEALAVGDLVRAVGDGGDVARRVVRVRARVDPVSHDRGRVTGRLAVDDAAGQFTRRLVEEVCRPDPARVFAADRAEHFAEGRVRRLGRVPVGAGVST